MEQKVEFLICGAQKAGTTALDAYLRRHPNIVTPACKEVHFFDRETLNWENNKEKTKAREEMYHNMFRGRKKGTWGESTPIYLYWLPCAKRIKQYNPDMKLIIVLRNPISRAYSHWNMETLRGRENLSFIEAIKREKERCDSTKPYQNRIWSYVSRGYYSEQIKHIWRHFDPSQLLICRQENLIKDPESTLGKVYRHIGVNNHEFKGHISQNKSVYRCSISEEAWKWLKKQYEEEVNKLEELLQWNCKSWLEPY